MHHIYNTEAYVLAVRDQGETDRQFKLFTDEFGLIQALALGVRAEKSKLRYSLQPYSRLQVSIVRSKTGWRLTGAKLDENLFAVFRSERRKLEIVERTFSLLRRLLQGEEPDRELFLVLSKAFQFLKGPADAGVFEVVLVLRVLDRLGYYGPSAETRRFVETADWDEAVLKEARLIRSELVRSINLSLHSSQL